MRNCWAVSASQYWEITWVLIPSYHIFINMHKDFFTTSRSGIQGQPWTQFKFCKIIGNQLPNNLHFPLANLSLPTMSIINLLNIYQSEKWKIMSSNYILILNNETEHLFMLIALMSNLVYQFSVAILCLSFGYIFCLFFQQCESKSTLFYLLPYIN